MLVNLGTETKKKKMESKRVLVALLSFFLLLGCLSYCIEARVVKNTISEGTGFKFLAKFCFSVGTNSY